MLEYNAQYIGSYLLEGLPCRIVADEDSNEGVRGEIYASGEGFVPFDFMEIIDKGRMVSEAQLKQSIMKRIR